MKTIYLKVEVPDDSNVETLIADLQYGYADETSIQFTEIILPMEEDIVSKAISYKNPGECILCMEWLLNKMKGE